MLRLLADDLSGALDSAAPFASARGPFPVTWSRPPDENDGDLALNSETREADAASAAATVGALAPWLARAPIAFKKLDSRLRGHPLVEIAAVSIAGGFRTTVVAPAFPAQGRVTRRGRQYVRQPDGHWADTGIDICAELGGLGLDVQAAVPRAGGGVFVCDAEADSDLAGISARRGELELPVLWCGSAGLARVLAGAGQSSGRPMTLPSPVLVLVGSPHPATRAQLQNFGLKPGRVWRHDLDLPTGTPADEARSALERLVVAVAAGPQPASAVVVGGETLMRLCHALGASALEVRGEIEPGVAVSCLIGGSWHGIPIVSKSGGFGDPGLLIRVLAERAGAALA